MKSDAINKKYKNVGNDVKYLLRWLRLIQNRLKDIAIINTNRKKVWY